MLQCEVARKTAMCWQRSCYRVKDALDIHIDGAIPIINLQALKR